MFSKFRFEGSGQGFRVLGCHGLWFWDLRVCSVKGSGLECFKVTGLGV